MNIQVGSQFSTSPYLTTPTSTVQATTSPSSAPSNQTDTVQISQAAQNLAAASQANSTPGSSGTYDFTNTTPEDMETVMNNLIKTGKLSVDQSGPLMATIGFAMSPQTMGSNGQPVIGATSSQPTNFIALLQTELQGMQSRNEIENSDNVSATLSTLLSLQGTRES